MTNRRGSVMTTDAKIIDFITKIRDMVDIGSVPHQQMIVDLLYSILVSFISITLSKA